MTGIPEKTVNRLADRDRIGSFLGIAAKAGKLLYGTELCREAVQNGGSKGKTPCLLLLAKNASAGTVKRIVNCCAYYRKEVWTLPLTADEVSHATGRPGLIACVALTDEGFARAMKDRLKQYQNPEQSQQTEVDG